MKKLSVCIMSMLAAVSIMIGTGCVTSNPNIDQSANTIGTMSAAIWLSAENPNAAQKTNIINALEVIRMQVDSIASTTQSLVTIASPIIQNWIGKNVSEKDKPIVSIVMLIMITDMGQMFEVNPAWLSTPVDKSYGIVSFINGAERVLRMSMLTPNPELNRIGTRKKS